MIVSDTLVQDSILERMAVLGDPIRCRLLLLLETHELSVSELCSTMRSPQSTISRHLKLLATDGWVGARRDGTRRLYSARARTSEPARRLWRLVRRELEASQAAREDRRRLETVLADRDSRSRAFFSSVAGRWEGMRQELFGPRVELEALLGLLAPAQTVGDLGTGTGQVARVLAPYVRCVIGVDESPEMLAAAKQRLAGFDNVELRRGALEDLPIADETLDSAILILVLHHVAEPQRVLAEASRVLDPAGRLLIVDMLPHQREDLRRQMGHVWLGFDEAQISAWLAEAGLELDSFRLPQPQPRATGPALFAATAIRSPQPQEP